MPHVTANVRLPSELVARPGNLPGHCTRHGRPATRRKDFALQSKVKLEGKRIFATNVLSQTGRVAQHGRKVQVVHVKGWPLCAACVRTRSRWLAVASVLFFGGLVTFAGSLVVAAFTDGMGWLAAVAVGGFVLMPLAAFPFARGSMGRVIGATTAPDGASVIVENPSGAFLAELPGHRS